jgi:hypothetical protein
MKVIVHKRRRLALVLAGTLVLVALAGAGIILSPAAQSASSPSANQVAPDWLTQTAKDFVAAYSAGTTAVSAEWVLTTAGQYKSTVPEDGPIDPDYANVANYVVVMHGSFVIPDASLLSEKQAPPSGTTAVLAIDPKTQSVFCIAILTTPYDSSPMGQMSPLAL